MPVTPPRKHYFRVPENWSEMAEGQKQAWGRTSGEHIAATSAEEAAPDEEDAKCSTSRTELARRWWSAGH